MSDGPNPSWHRRRGRLGRRGAALLALVVLCARAATGQGPALGSAALAGGGALPVTFSVAVDLRRLHPAATKGALECGVILQTKAWIDAHRGTLVDYDSVSHSVLAPAHYYRESAVIEFPLTGGAYAGTLTFTTTLSGAALTDPATHAAFAPAPTALIACWLQINGRPAAWDQASGLAVVGAGNFASLNQSPLVIGVADASAGAPINVSGKLSGQGPYFVPGTVALAENLSVTGPNAPAAALATTGTGSGLNRGSLGAPAASGQTTPALVGPAGKPGIPGTAGGTFTPPAALATPAVPAVVGHGTTPPINSAPPAGANTGGAVKPTNLASVPAVTGVTVESSNPGSHTIVWACVAHELSCFGDGSTGNPNYSYEISVKEPGATTFSPLNPPANVASRTIYEDPNYTRLEAPRTAFIAPQTTFRVTRKDPTGHLMSAFMDYVDVSPPQPQEPASLTAVESEFGKVTLTWPTVAGAVAYRLFDATSNAPPARFPATNPPPSSNGSATNCADTNNACPSTAPPTESATTNTVPPGTRTYRLATEYAAGYRTTGLPEATVLVHAVPPARSIPYLSKKNGTGSAVLATLHVTSNNLRMDAGLSGIVNKFGLITGWDGNSFPTFPSATIESRYANVTELGLGRSIACWQWPEQLGGIAVGWVTFCVAGNHGTTSASTLPDTASVVASDTAQPSSFGVIVTSPLKGQLFVNLVPDRSSYNSGADLLNLANFAWGDGWNISTTTTLDSEGAKYAPNACLACHGGTVNAGTGKVSGASLLPIDPGLVVFGNTPGSDRAANEESVRAINAMIAQSLPAAAVSDYISGLYNGKVAVAGSAAQSNYVPAAWSQQASLFQAVVKPDCLMCHLATSAANNFGSAASFMQNKALIYSDVCVAHSMPHAQVPYQRFWTTPSPLPGTTGTLAGYLMTSLGYSSCP